MLKKLSLNLRENIYLFIGTVGFFILLLFIYGLIPCLHIPFLPPFYAMAGATECLVNQGIFTENFCMNMGYPLGAPALQGLPQLYISALFAILFGLDSYTSVTVTSALFILCALISMIYLLKKLEVNKYIALFCSFLYLSSFIVYGQVSYGPLRYGFALLPFYILIDYLFFSKVKELINESFRVNLLKGLPIFIIASIVKIAALFMDGYSFMISSLASFCILFVFVVYDFKLRNVRTIFLGVGGFALYNLLAAILYKTYVPGSTTFVVMSIDYFRAMGVDLVTLIFPINLLFVNFLGIEVNWNWFEFYADGSNVRFNYLGFFLFLAFISYIILSKRKNIYVKAIIISGLMAFILSLGPSLKINDRRMIEENTYTGFTDYLLPDKDDISKMSHSSRKIDYLMPAEDATLNLHTNLIYRIPGIKNMRAVQRWLVLFKFSLIVGTGMFLTFLINKKRNKWAYLLLLLIFIELFPNIGPLLSKYNIFYKERLVFDKEVILKLKKYVKPNEKVFFMSHENDYMVNYIAPKVNIYSYNIGGDKNIRMSFKSWPDEIKTMRKYLEVHKSLLPKIQTIERYKNVTEIPNINVLLDDLTSFIERNMNTFRDNENNLLILMEKLKIWEEVRKLQNFNDNCSVAFSENLLDCVIIPHFSLRWNSYRWPPTEEDRIKWIQKRFSIFNETDERFQVSKEKWFSIVRPKKSEKFIKEKFRCGRPFIGF